MTKNQIVGNLFQELREWLETSNIRFDTNKKDKITEIYIKQWETQEVAKGRFIQTPTGYLMIVKPVPHNGRIMLKNPLTGELHNCSELIGKEFLSRELL